MEAAGIVNAAAGARAEEEYYREAMAALLGRAALARRDPVKFFEFVMRAERGHEVAPVPPEGMTDEQQEVWAAQLDVTDGLRIKVAPHQKVMLDFAEAHDRSVVMLPADHAKTFTGVGLTLYRLQGDVTRRGAIVSATQAQAKKPLKMVRSYVEASDELKLVNPRLRPTMREGEPWSMEAITVDRPLGIRDPSLVAFGMDGAITGSRLDDVSVDDLLSPENTRTKDSRRKINQWFDTAVLSRVVPRGGRVTVTNVAMHPEDLLHTLRDAGWPTLRMDIEGEIEILNTTWDSDDLRPVDGESPMCRLVEHDPDPDNLQTLWPERYDRAGVERLKTEHLPAVFNHLYKNLARTDESSMCQQEYIDKCKARGRAENIELVSEYRGPNMTFTGVDLAIKDGEEHDCTAFFTFEVRPGGLRVVLDIEIGQYPGPVIVAKILRKHEQYRSIVAVENNGAQDYIRQFALAKDISIPLKAHTTGKQKANPTYGVPQLFLEMSNGAWAIPNDRRGRCHPHVQKWIDECLYYAPSKHTGDALMACYFAREQAKKFGAGKVGAGNKRGGSLGMSILAR